MQASKEVPQVSEDGLDLGVGVVEHRSRSGVLRSRPGLCDAEVHRQGGESLLDAVVQVPLALVSEPLVRARTWLTDMLILNQYPLVQVSSCLVAVGLLTGVGRMVLRRKEL